MILVRLMLHCMMWMLMISKCIIIYLINRMRWVPSFSACFGCKRFIMTTTRDRRRCMMMMVVVTVVALVLMPVEEIRKVHIDFNDYNMM
jgi:hypothetical protein